MSRRIIHMQGDVAGMIRNRMFDCLQRDDGTPLSPKEGEAALRDLLARGVKLIPCGPKCEGWSDETGCPGHDVPDPVGWDGGDGVTP